VEYVYEKALCGELLHAGLPIAEERFTVLRLKVLPYLIMLKSAKVPGVECWILIRP
jgi:hypothetical protein